MCKHYLGGWECKAFKEIPIEILRGENEHSKPLKGQENNLVFESTDGTKQQEIEQHRRMILIYEMQMDRSGSVFERSSLSGNIDYHTRMIEKLYKELDDLELYDVKL